MTLQLKNSGEAARIRKLARKLLTKELFMDPKTRRMSNVLQALPVFNSERELNSWFVPLVVEERLIAFCQFLPDGTFMRFSNFYHHSGKFEDCPFVVDWLDITKIKERIEKFRDRDEAIGEPFLSFDKIPDRIVWSVPIISSDGNLRYMYVIGEVVYLPTLDNGVG